MINSGLVDVFTDDIDTALGSYQIAMVDEVLVVNVGGYAGESTRREIEHARSLGIPVSFLEPAADDHDAVG